jgi:hypothetical protein
MNELTSLPSRLVFENSRGMSASMRIEGALEEAKFEYIVRDFTEGGLKEKGALLTHGSRRDERFSPLNLSH